MFIASRYVYICDHCHVNFLDRNECLTHEGETHKTTETNKRVRTIKIKPDTSGFTQ